MAQIKVLTSYFLGRYQEWEFVLLNLQYNQIPKLQCFSSSLTIVFAQSIGVKLRMKM